MCLREAQEFLYLVFIYVELQGVKESLNINKLLLK